MQTQLELYKMWAPDDAMWTQWAKPVVFMNMKHTQLYDPSGLETRSIKWIGYETGTAIIVDLAGKSGLEEGIGLARLGYRPVPLYNGIPSPNHTTAAVPVDGIVNGLCGGAGELPGLSLSKRANPAFLLDAGRMKGAKKKPGTFDNRWCVVAQDMPSASYFKRHNIKRILVRTDKVQEDLQHLLYNYQRNGISIYTCKESGNLVQYKVRKPKDFKGMFYRFLVFFGLARCATGGFGSVIPVPSESSGGHYRAG